MDNGITKKAFKSVCYYSHQRVAFAKGDQQIMKENQFFTETNRSSKPLPVDTFATNVQRKK